MQCIACGHRYVDPRPTQEDIARAYSLPTAYEDWLRTADVRAAMWRRRFDRLLGNVPVGRLLDIGAGIGTFLAIARDRGWTVDGTEVSTTAIAHARDAHDLAIREGFVEDAELRGPFDVITLWHVLEHLPDPARTLRFCRGILGEHSMLILIAKDVLQQFRQFGGARRRHPNDAIVDPFEEPRRALGRFAGSCAHKPRHGSRCTGGVAWVDAFGREGEVEVPTGNHSVSLQLLPEGSGRGPRVSRGLEDHSWPARSDRRINSAAASTLARSGSLA